MRFVVLISALSLLVALPAVAQIAEPDTLYDSGSMSFDYVQTPFPNYSGSFAAEGEGLMPDGTLPPGVIQAVGGGSALAELDTVSTVAYAVIDNQDGTYDGALVSLKTIGPLTAGTYNVDPLDGTALFGFIDDAVEFALPDTFDSQTVYQWLQDLEAAHKLVSASGTIEITEVNADTLYGTFGGATADIGSAFFFVNVNSGVFNLSGADLTSVAPTIPDATAPTVRAVPNPFNPRTSVIFALPRAGSVDVGVYDAAGRRLRTLHRGSLPEGEHRLQWDGRGAGGERVAAGVYLVRVSGDGWRTSTKVTLAP